MIFVREFQQKYCYKNDCFNNFLYYLCTRNQDKRKI